MRGQPPPLRFLTATVGLWICGRALILAPNWRVAAAPAEPAGPAAALAPARLPDAAPQPPPAPVVPAPEPVTRMQAAWMQAAEARAILQSRPGRALPAFFASAAPAVILPPRDRTTAARDAVPFETLPSLRTRASPNRLSGSAWLLLRDEGGGSLAPVGTLGASQSGVRLVWRLNGDAGRPLALSARLTARVSQRPGAEVALGLDWRPLARIPVHILAERRQGLRREGRSAFALALYGGVSEVPLAAGFRLEAYAQAGVVGARSRDLFADGAARIGLPVSRRLSMGAGLSGGAQPGAARLDAGPAVSLRLPVAGESLRLSAEYRFRIAGDARPGSGPTLTLSTDF